MLIGKVDGYIKENNGSEHLVFTSTDGNKKVLAKLTKLWNEIIHCIETINEGRKVSMKKFHENQFNLDDNLPLSKML